jgi:hypothetical protein
MADDKKKEEKPFVDPYSLMKTEDLIKHFEKHYANTPEDADRREGYEHERQGYADTFENIQNSYLKAKRGESKTKGAPKRYALSKKDVNVESSELVNKVLLAMVELDHTNDKGEPNKAILELYKNNPHLLQDYARSKNIDYHEIKQDLINNYRNIKKAEKFNEFKSNMAQLLIKDIQKLNRVQTELYTNTAHHNKIKAHVKGALEKTGYTLEETVNPREALGHYANMIQSGGKLPEDYILQRDQSIKKYEKKPK